MTLRIVLGDDPEPTVHAPVGIFLEHASTRDAAAVHRLLTEHGSTM